MRQTADVTSVGLTGGIGSGKSAVAELLSSYGAVIVDADVLAREAVAPGSPGLARVVEEFGPDVLAGDGSLDRARLAGLVFADPDRRAALNAIVHPYVRRRSEELTAAAPEGAVVVQVVPLLVENDLQGGYDVVVVVDASDEVQEQRLVGLRGMTPEDARARIAAQAGREERRAAADVVIDNDGTRAELEEQVRELWDRLRH
ncbi:MAG: dephospho-CoA kinase [Actinomycetota bacterium]|nr:dephospho-CoA kinase [Actinomycetota bacterium]